MAVEEGRGAEEVAGRPNTPSRHYNLGIIKVFIFIVGML